MKPTKFRDSDPASWRGPIDVNLYGVMNCSRVVINPMVEKGWGRIVTIASGAGVVGLNIGVSPYGGGKGGAIGFMRHLAVENARAGVTANTLAIGLMEQKGDRSVTEALAKQIPVGAPARRRTSATPSPTWPPPRPSGSPARPCTSTAARSPPEPSPSRRAGAGLRGGGTRPRPTAAGARAARRSPPTPSATPESRLSSPFTWAWVSPEHPHDVAGPVGVLGPQVGLVLAAGAVLGARRRCRRRGAAAGRGRW